MAWSLPTAACFNKEIEMKKIHHMVVLKFKPGTSTETVTQLYGALSELQRLIPGIEAFAGGPYSSPEGLNQEFTHGFLFTFSSAMDRDRYLTHPDHERVKDQFMPSVENVIAFDFEFST
jgi:hypothetical protein